MELAGTAALAALVKKIVDFVKYLSNRDVNAVVTQLVSWAAGVAVAFLAKEAGVQVTDTVLDNVNNWAIALFGVNLSSVAGVVWDAIKAVDGSNSSVVPNLLGSTNAPQGTEGSPAPVHGTRV